MLVVVPASALGAQGLGARSWSGVRYELGAAISTPIVEDGNGVSVRRGPGPIAAGEGIWRLDDRTSVIGALRGAVAPLRMRSLGNDWSGGWMQQLDFGLRVERDVSRSMLLGVGLAAAALRGPDDIVPFAVGSSGVVYGWGPELVAGARISRTRALHAILGADAIRISPGGREAEVGGGWIGRARVGLRYAP